MYGLRPPHAAAFEGTLVNHVAFLFDLSSAEWGLLVVAAVIWFAGYRFAGGRFVRPQWKKPGKFLFYMLVSWGLLAWVGSYALFFIVGHQALGFAGHLYICRQHDIDWRTCEPEERYLALTKRWARGEFSSSPDGPGT